MSFGPQLPPHLQKQKSSPEDESESKESDEDQSIGPALPPGFKKSQREESGSEKDDDQSIGPALPPGFKKKPPDGAGPSRGPSVGPSSIGPSRPNERLEPPESDDDDDVIGPQLPGSSSSSQMELEARAHKLRVQAVQDKLREEEEGQKATKRETWMLELPEEKAKSFGLGPRTFSKGTEKKGKRDSTWTDTPEDRARKAAMAGEDNKGQHEDEDHATDPEVVEYLAGLKRDQAMDATAKALKAKRGESLYESHQTKKAKIDKAKATQPGVRRPFDREQDLQVNRFDEAAKAAMLKKARKMDERFVSGQNKYI